MKRLVTCAFTIILRFHTCQTLRLLGACHHNICQVPKGAEGTAAVLGDRIGARGQNRCPGAAAGPGRASRSTTPSRRLACGDLAGGPPPTGTWTIGSAAVTREALHPLEGAAPVRERRTRYGRCTQSEGVQRQPMGSCTHRQHAQIRIGRMQQRLGLQHVPHAGRLFRTRAACSARGRGCPDSEQQAHVRMRRPRLHIASLRTLQRAWCRAAPLLSHAGCLFRTRAACPVHGRGCPDSEQQAHVRMRRPHQSTQSTNPINTTRPITPHVDLLGWKAPLDLLGLLDLRGLRDPARPRDRPLRAAGSRRAYCRSDSSRFARTTMPMRSTIASSTQLPSSAARRGCIGASSKRRSKPRIARHRGMSSSW